MIIDRGNVARLAAATTGKLHHGVYDIKTFSPWRDVLIVAMTIRTILTGFRAR